MGPAQSQQNGTCLSRLLLCSAFFLLAVGSFSSYGGNFLSWAHDQTGLRYDLLGHLCGHAALTAGLCNTICSKKLFAFLSSSALSVVIEGVQASSFVPTRSGSFDDFVAGVLGSAFGVMVSDLIPLEYNSLQRLIMPVNRAWPISRSTDLEPSALRTTGLTNDASSASCQSSAEAVFSDEMV